jgi:tetratricopeptide (TPR) repeat protein
MMLRTQSPVLQQKKSGLAGGWKKGVIWSGNMVTRIPPQPRQRTWLSSVLLARSRTQHASFLSVLRDDPKFRWAIVVLFFGFLLIGIILPKVWITSPKEFNPVIRVSGLDLLQVKALSRSARRLEANGRLQEAIQAWSSAVANNPADPMPIRGFISLVLRIEQPETRWVNSAAGQAYWLLRLSGTNDADIELAGQIYVKGGYYEDAWSLLSPTNRTLTTRSARALAAVAFETQRMDAFASIWDRNRQDFEKDPEIALYHAAWGSIWGPAIGTASSLKELEAAIESKSLKALALRLKLMVDSQRQDIASFERTFGLLQDLRADRVEDHVRSWLLYEAAGQKSKAQAMATAYAVPLRSESEAEAVVLGWLRLGMHDLAVDFAKTQLSQFPASPMLWGNIAHLLIDAHEWDELRILAANLRNQPYVSRYFGGYVDYLEGVSESGLSHRERAMECFRAFLKNPRDLPVFMLDAALLLRREGYAEFSQQLFVGLEEHYAKQVEFWVEFARATFETRDAELFLHACEKAYKIRPDSPMLENNYAAALIITQKNPSEAIRLTLNVVDRSQRSSISLINHGLALNQNGRFKESHELLDSVSQAGLSNEEKTFLNLGQFESAMGEQRRSGAKAYAQAVDKRYLFPPQLERFNRLLASLEQGRGR